MVLWTLAGVRAWDVRRGRKAAVITRRCGQEEGSSRMCLSCGCGEPHDNHGDRRHITYENVKKAADAAKIPVKEVVKNIQVTFTEKRPRSK